MSEHNGGGGGQLPDGFSQVVLTLDRMKFTLQLGGKTENLNEALAICQMACEELKSRIATARAEAVLTGPARLTFDMPTRGRRVE